MNNKIVSAILPEALEETLDFQAGVVVGYHRCGNDLVAKRATTDEELNNWTDELMCLYPGEYSADWYAGVLAGYRVRREQYEQRANQG